MMWYKISQQDRASLQNALLVASQQSCNCMTKSNVVSYHAPTCPYRLYQENVTILNNLSPFRTKTIDKTKWENDIKYDRVFE